MNLSDLTTLAQTDPGLTEQQKNQLSDSKVQKDIAELLASGTGATLAVIVAKYLKLSKPVQIILGVLGFGAGKLVYDTYTKHKSNTNYDDKTKAYKIDTDRY